MCVSVLPGLLCLLIVYTLPTYIYLVCYTYLVSIAPISTCIRDETGLDHLGNLGHILPKSTGSDPLLKISMSDPDTA